MQKSVALIDPRPDGRLEELHDGAYGVEDDDDARFAQCLEPQHEHEHLDGDRGEHEKVVARQHGVVGVPELGRDEHRQERCAEDARPGLLEHEHDEFDGTRAPPVFGCTVEHSMGPRVDARLDGGELARHRCPFRAACLYGETVGSPGIQNRHG